MLVRLLLVKVVLVLVLVRMRARLAGVTPEHAADESLPRPEQAADVVADGETRPRHGLRPRRQNNGLVLRRRQQQQRLLRRRVRRGGRGRRRSHGARGRGSSLPLWPAPSGQPPSCKRKTHTKWRGRIVGSCWSEEGERRLCKSRAEVGGRSGASFLFRSRAMAIILAAFPFGRLSLSLFFSVSSVSSPFVLSLPWPEIGKRRSCRKQSSFPSGAAESIRCLPSVLLFW